MSEGTAVSNTLTLNIKSIIKQNAQNMIEINKKKSIIILRPETENVILNL